MEFEILKGGLPDHPTHEFIDASVTDTRLMGVLGLRVHWLVFPIDSSNVDEIKDVYHFYYFDIEEIGLDYLNIYELDGEDGVELATTACFGGLGAKMIPLTEKETLHLIKYFVDDTIKKGERVHPNAIDHAFLYENAPDLTEEEKAVLNQKMCTEIKTDYGVVNYFLMRQFGKDFEGAQFLVSPLADPANIDDISLEAHATFLKNSIEIFTNVDESISYLSESLVESADTHYIVTSEIRVADGKVVLAKKKSQFEISLMEASVILSRKEYCNAYKIIVPMEDFDVDFTSISIGATKTSHETGDMYMEFKKNNNHVESGEFRLYNDIAALYYVTDYGELIVATYTIGEMMQAEKNLLSSPLIIDINLEGRAQFPRSVLYEFAQSGMTSFGNFLSTLE